MKYLFQKFPPILAKAVKGLLKSSLLTNINKRKTFLICFPIELFEVFKLDLACKCNYKLLCVRLFKRVLNMQFCNGN